MPKKQRGFTLLELLVVIAIIGILVTIAIVAINPVQRLKEARDAVRMADIRNIALALNAYNVDNGHFPKETGCDSSRGQAGGTACNWWPVGDHIHTPIPPPGQSDWASGPAYTDYIKDQLVPKYIGYMPKDPINNDEYFYSYEPRNDPKDLVPGDIQPFLCYNDATEGYCEQYAVTAHLEADPTETFTCSSEHFTGSGPGGTGGYEPGCYIRHDLGSQ
jgi:general secretion pathway protein G